MVTVSKIIGTHGKVLLFLMRKTHVKYKSSSTHRSKGMSKINWFFFQKWVKLQRQGHRVKNNGTMERSYQKEYSCEISKL